MDYAKFSMRILSMVENWCSSQTCWPLSKCAFSLFDPPLFFLKLFFMEVYAQCTLHSAQR